MMLAVPSPSTSPEANTTCTMRAARMPYCYQMPFALEFRHKAGVTIGNRRRFQRLTIEELCDVGLSRSQACSSSAPATRGRVHCGLTYIPTAVAVPQNSQAFVPGHCYRVLCSRGGCRGCVQFPCRSARCSAMTMPNSLPHTCDANARGQQRLQAAAPAAQLAAGVVATCGRCAGGSSTVEPVLAEEARERQHCCDDCRTRAEAEHVLWQPSAIDLSGKSAEDSYTTIRLWIWTCPTSSTSVFACEARASGSSCTCRSHQLGHVEPDLGCGRGEVGPRHFVGAGVQLEGAHRHEDAGARADQHGCKLLPRAHPKQVGAPASQPARCVHLATPGTAAAWWSVLASTGRPSEGPERT